MKQISFQHDILPLKDLIFRMALRITMNREEAEDLVQDTLLKMWSRRDQLADIENLEAYCITLCRHLAIDRRRAASHRPEPMVHEEGRGAGAREAAAHTTPYERMIEKDRMQLVRRIVDELPEKQRCCLQLRDFEEMSYREIAQAMDISEEQVKVNIFRARQAVKKKYNEIDRYGL